MKKSFIYNALFAGYLAVSATAVWAADVEITQKDKKFSQTTLTLKANDTITFVNDDNVAHNAYSRSAGNEFELPQQKPGEKNTITLKKPGEVKIQCAMHPQMKIVVKVE